MSQRLCFGVRIPYESPESEALEVCIEDRFMTGTNSDNNEKLEEDDEVNP